MVSALTVKQQYQIARKSVLQKLANGVTLSELSHDEKWALWSLENYDHLYHTSYVNKFRRAEDGALVFNLTPTGEIIYTAGYTARVELARIRS